MIALGTHPPMSEEAICARLGITATNARTFIAACSCSTTNGRTPTR